MAAILKSLDVGYGRRVSRELNETLMQDLDALFRRCRVWSDEFMPAAREEYSGLMSGEIDGSEVPQLRFTTFAYSIAFIRVLAGCYRLWMGEHSSWEPLAEFVRRAPISYGTGHGLLVDAGLVSPDGTTAVCTPTGSCCRDRLHSQGSRGVLGGNGDSLPQSPVIQPFGNEVGPPMSSCDNEVTGESDVCS